MEAYHHLKNLRVELAGTSSILVRDDVWPRINYANTALKKYVFEQDQKSFLEVEEFIKNDLFNLLNEQGEKLKKEFNHVLNSKYLKESIRYKLKMDLTNQILNIPRTSIKDTRINDVIFMISSNMWYEYYIKYIEFIIDEKKSERRNFILGCILSVVGILTSIALTIFSMA